MKAETDAKFAYDKIKQTDPDEAAGYLQTAVQNYAMAAVLYKELGDASGVDRCQGMLDILNDQFSLSSTPRR